MSSACTTCLHAERLIKQTLKAPIMDILVDAGILKDDNSNIVAATDGSRVLYDKSNPRTEIFIEEMEDEADANLRTLP